MPWGEWVPGGTFEITFQLTNSNGPARYANNGTDLIALSTMLRSAVSITDYDPPGRRDGRIWPGSEVPLMPGAVKAGHWGNLVGPTPGPWVGYSFDTSVDLLKLADAGPGPYAEYGGYKLVRLGWMTRGHGSPEADHPRRAWSNVDSDDYPIGVPYDEAEAWADVSVAVVWPMRVIHDMWPVGTFASDNDREWSASEVSIADLNLLTNGQGITIARPPAWTQVENLTDPAAGSTGPGATIPWPSTVASLGPVVGTITTGGDETFPLNPALIDTTAPDQSLAFAGIPAGYDTFDVPQPEVGSGLRTGGVEIEGWFMDLRVTVRFPDHRDWLPRGLWLRQRQVPSTWRSARQARPVKSSSRQDRWR